jgi:tetratricopeptide (TPR) repeat protein
MTRTWPRLVGVSLLAATVAAACSSDRTGSVPAEEPARSTSPQAPPLPDISRLVPTVRAQITERHAQLARVLATPSSTAIDQANAYGDLGRYLMAAQLPEAADAALRNAQSLNPSDYKWPYFLAHLARTQGDLPKALGLFERVLQLKPDDMDSLVWLGDTSLAAGRPDAAEPAFARALQLDPNSVSAKYGAGRTALAKGDNATAVRYLEEVLRSNPKAVAAHYPLSQAYAALGNEEKAAEHLRLRRDGRIAPRDTLMVELDTLLESPQTFESQGIRKLDEGDWAGAAEQFRKGLALAPDNAALHHRLGTALSMMDDPKGARAEFETAVQKQADYFPAQFEYFRAALRARPDYTEAQLRLASSLRRTGQVSEALDVYQQVRSRQPENPEARMGYVMTLTRARRDAEARDVLVEAMKAPAGAGNMYTHALARLLATSSDPKVRDGARALELLQPLLQSERSLDLGETYAMALAETGQFREAQAVQRDLTTAATRAGLTAVKRRLEERQALYDRADPCRTTWTDEEMP